MTEVGAVTIQVPRDRLGIFTPSLLPRYARRTGVLDEMVLSLTAKGLTGGEIVARLAEVYGMTTSKETVSTVTDQALEPMTEWRTRPLDPLYPVVFVDAIHVKIGRDAHHVICGETSSAAPVRRSCRRAATGRTVRASARSTATTGIGCGLRSCPRCR
nr:transposase [Kitasatospora sp. CB01950]